MFGEDRKIDDSGFNPYNLTPARKQYLERLLDTYSERQVSPEAVEMLLAARLRPEDCLQNVKVRTTDALNGRVGRNSLRGKVAQFVATNRDSAVGRTIRLHEALHARYPDVDWEDRDTYDEDVLQIVSDLRIHVAKWPMDAARSVHRDLDTVMQDETEELIEIIQRAIPTLAVLSRVLTDPGSYEAEWDDEAEQRLGIPTGGRVPPRRMVVTAGREHFEKIVAAILRLTRNFIISEFMHGLGHDTNLVDPDARATGDEELRGAVKFLFCKDIPAEIGGLEAATIEYHTIEHRGLYTGIVDLAHLLLHEIKPWEYGFGPVTADRVATRLEELKPQQPFWPLDPEKRQERPSKPPTPEPSKPSEQLTTRIGESPVNVVHLEPKKLPVWRRRERQTERRSMGMNIHAPSLASAYAAQSTTGLFKTRRMIPTTSGTVLIDASGSMALSLDDVMELVRSAPAATIAYYYGYNDQRMDGREIHGDLVIAANEGKVYDRDELPDRKGGGNAIDYYVLNWLLEQEEPRIVVTDGGFCGGRPEQSVAAARLVRRESRKGTLTQVEGLDEALDLFDTIRERERSARNRPRPR